jgi:hypothetical protein
MFPSVGHMLSCKYLLHERRRQPRVGKVESGKLLLADTIW